MQSSEIFPSQSYAGYQPGPQAFPASQVIQSRAPNFIFNQLEVDTLTNMGYFNPNDYTKSPPGAVQNRIQELTNDIRKMGSEIGGLKRTKNKNDWNYTQIDAFEYQQNLMKKYKNILENYMKTVYK